MFDEKDTRDTSEKIDMIWYDILTDRVYLEGEGGASERRGMNAWKYNVSEYLRETRVDMCTLQAMSVECNHCLTCLSRERDTCIYDVTR